MTTNQNLSSTETFAADGDFVDNHAPSFVSIENLTPTDSLIKDRVPISGQVLINVALSAAHVYLAFDPKALEIARRTELLNQAIRRGFVAPKASTK